MFLSETSIEQPTILINGTPNNCLISIEHKTNAACIRMISYCLIIDNSTSQCHTNTSLESLLVPYPQNTATVNLVVKYDVIYVNYSFRIPIGPCSDDHRKKSHLT
jgi:hypothetical protein